MSFLQEIFERASATVIIVTVIIGALSVIDLLIVIVRIPWTVLQLVLLQVHLVLFVVRGAMRWA